LFRRGTETLARANGTMRIDTPVVELVGGSETDGTANFEVRDGEVTAFAVSSEMLRAAAR
jgi:pyocin large subunit-like protein